MHFFLRFSPLRLVRSRRFPEFLCTARRGSCRMMIIITAADPGIKSGCVAMQSAHFVGPLRAQFRFSHDVLGRSLPDAGRATVGTERKNSPRQNARFNDGCSRPHRHECGPKRNSDSRRCSIETQKEDALACHLTLERRSAAF